ncbi:tRNA (adenosine(37)-N6)-threonylcarbamoyltransferase complex ATPase subunit type 1 TsaE [Candidatus Giovannonibacteria bacterium RIFCSPHIGHO2_01_FULL_48_47]|nr:MAG: tRNA (adenosine(37)-N6)-threonylcarbamoyltransferase complex ATPase subunit type 1 TsaE [Candidatus Giovannonibacteria bacterium RIFCSPHIGHO2_01_FULL_48_47]OGF68717.1 MAG: tRNA (adenosine(37)-N6)-threonylcarbamoyltransferase complex ATPase subunit type 1 TsaE [Candidatus Giovannonibacteria bacterium RIFCSPHIGHO2_02_FULL_48_15]OGF89633.1 MAG: tRNA (adenosine(37)-N6)-threonylcarbamoyltransferase complex ATPase subunit type 1 TsaE [Candidatus Giovannonibacteria bacterium RIFCSPLOWO2_01_FULL_
MKEILRVLSRSEAETKKFAEVFAKEILKLKQKTAVVVGLEGELGAGKTTFAKGFAKGLGIKEEMKSPTFILMRVFRSPTSRGSRTSGRHFFHIDAFRAELDFSEFLKSPRNILLIEWSDKVRKIMPKKYFQFRFKHIAKNSREIRLYA